MYVDSLPHVIVRVVELCFKNAKRLIKISLWTAATVFGTATYMSGTDC